MITIKDISRTGHVTRWHAVRTMREQTLAEHQYLVTMYAKEIAKRILTGYTIDDELKLTNWCLEHDTPEILTGDIATPAKRRIQESFVGKDDPIDELESSVASESFKTALAGVEGNRLEVVSKLADLMEGIVFIHTEGITDHARVIEQRMLGSFFRLMTTAKNKYPLDDWERTELILNEVIRGRDGQLDFDSDH